MTISPFRRTVDTAVAVCAWLAVVGRSARSADIYDGIRKRYGAVPLQTATRFYDVIRTLEYAGVLTGLSDDAFGSGTPERVVMLSRRPEELFLVDIVRPFCVENGSRCPAVDDTVRRMLSALDDVTLADVAAADDYDRFMIMDQDD